MEYEVYRKKYKPDEQESAEFLQCAVSGKYLPRTHFHIGSGYCSEFGPYKIRGKVSKDVRNPNKQPKANPKVQLLEDTLSDLRTQINTLTETNVSLQTLIETLFKQNQEQTSRIQFLEDFVNKIKQN